MILLATASDSKHKGGYYQLLRRQAERQGMYLIHEPIEDFSWTNLLVWEKDFCERHPGERVVFVDTADFLMVGTKLELEGIVPHNGILYHSEAKCWPEPHKADRYPECKTPYRYVNGTGPCGSTDAIAEAITWGMKNVPIRGNSGSIFADNDQRFWGDVFLSGRGRVDTHCRLSVQLNAVQEQEIAVFNGRLHMRLTVTTPVFVHLNGASSIVYKDIIAELAQ